MNSLKPDEISVGLRLRSVDAVERADGIEFPPVSYFRVVGVDGDLVHLRCTESGSHWKSQPVQKPADESDDWFHRIYVSIGTFNQSFEVLADENDEE